MVDVLVPLRLAQLGATAAVIGATFLAAAAVETVLSPVAGRLSDRRGAMVPVRISLAVAVAVSLLAPLLAPAPVLIAVLIVGMPAYGTLFAPSSAPAQQRCAPARPAPGPGLRAGQPGLGQRPDGRRGGERRAGPGHLGPGPVRPAGRGLPGHARVAARPLRQLPLGGRCRGLDVPGPWSLGHRETHDGRSRPKPLSRRTMLALRVGRGTGQEIAAFTSSATFFSTTGLHFLSAYDTGHMSPSSRFAASWKPRVE